MNNQFYHLHVWALDGFDTQTQIKNEDTQAPLVTNVGLKVDFWPKDDFFNISPVYFVTERLRANLINKGYAELEFEQIDRISKGANFRENFPDAQLPPFYWQLKINGQVGKDDFALWERLYLVVSKQALEFLRDNQVTHAEADLIDVSFDEYFGSSRKFFWMTENMKGYFTEMEAKNKLKV